MTAAQRKRILLVEDDVDIAEALGELLRELGHEVQPAANGALGLAALSLRRFDLVLLDLMMPVMDGYEFRARQLADPTLAAVPVIIVSADTKARRRLHDLRPAALFGKPVPIDALISTIDSITPPAAA